MGIEIHEAPRLNVQSDAVLEAGMVVTCEPGIYLPGEFGIRSELDVYISDRNAAVYGLPLQTEIIPLL